MNYELGQALKDAGFPQKEPNGFPGILNPDGDKDIYYPALSELIEACGLRFRNLSYSDILKRWSADAFLSVNINNDEYMHMKSEKGSTPEEAVAKLWLVLQSK